MDGPRPIDEVIGTNQFRDGAARFLDRVRTGGEVLLVRNEKRRIDTAVLVPPPTWEALGLMKRDLNRYSSRPNGTGGYFTREQLATQLLTEANELGGETVQLSAGEARCVAGLLAELAAHRGDEALGQLAGEWADRLGKRSATAK